MKKIEMLSDIAAGLLGVRQHQQQQSKEGILHSLAQEWEAQEGEIER